MIWAGVGGDAVGAITLQANDAVDDVVATLQPLGSRAFIQAKDRSSAIALTKRSKAFVETIASCVDQFLMLAPIARRGSRLLWVVPSTAGNALTNVLLEALDSHRKNASDSPFADFLRHRNSKDSKALKALVATVTDSWRQNAGTEPSEGELREFLRMLHVEICDFGRGNHRERQAQNLIRSHIAANPSEAARIWAKLEGHRANEIPDLLKQCSCRLDAARLREEQSAIGHPVTLRIRQAQMESELRQGLFAVREQLQAAIAAATEYVGIAAGGPDTAKTYPFARRHLEILSRHRVMPSATESTSARLAFLESAWLAIDAALASLCEIRFDASRKLGPT
jgi:hypothetical protein